MIPTRAGLLGRFLAHRRDVAGERWQQARGHLDSLEPVTSPGWSAVAERRARHAIGRAWNRVEFWDRLLDRWTWGKARGGEVHPIDDDSVLLRLDEQ